MAIKQIKFGLGATLAACLAACAEPAATEQATHETAPAVDGATGDFDTRAPDITEWMVQPAVLVFSKTRSWRHNEGIAGADKFFVEYARENGMGIFTTVNGAVFNAEQLARFDLVVFNSMTGDTLSPAQERALQEWTEAGGGIVALHGSGDGSHEDWAWYADKVIGPKFTMHPMNPQFQTARVEVLDPSHPVMAGLPASFEHTEEWYSFDGTPQDYGLNPLAGLDETTYDPTLRDGEGNETDLRMGEGAINHPIIWSTCIGKGRVVYSAFGHLDTTYDVPEVATITTNAANWVRGVTDEAGKGCR